MLSTSFQKTLVWPERLSLWLLSDELSMAVSQERSSRQLGNSPRHAGIDSDISQSRERIEVMKSSSPKLCAVLSDNIWSTIYVLLCEKFKGDRLQSYVLF
eukprot:g37634.t1